METGDSWEDGWRQGAGAASLPRTSRQQRRPRDPLVCLAGKRCQVENQDDDLLLAGVWAARQCVKPFSLHSFVFSICNNQLFRIRGQSRPQRKLDGGKKKKSKYSFRVERTENKKNSRLTLTARKSHLIVYCKAEQKITRWSASNTITQMDE